MKNTPEGINSRLDTEECISDQEYRIMEVSQSKQQKEKQILKWEQFKGPLRQHQHANIHIIGVLEGEEKEKGIKNVFDKIMAKNTPCLKKETDIQVQEAQRVPNKMKSNRPKTRHIKIKMTKV